MLTNERLKELLAYNPNTGIFTWNIKNRVGVRFGTIAGYTSKRGYINIKLDYELYQAHRLAWFYMTGTESLKLIDHINGNKSDNRWCNLREASQSQNLHNAKLSKPNTTGIKGIRFKNDKYESIEAKVTYKGKSYSKSLASVNRNKEETLNELVLWLQNTRKILHKEFTNHG